MKRGRPAKSEVRQNIVEILYFMKKAHGYDIFKVYRAIFPKTTLRSIYYNLRKGAELEEFSVERVEKEIGKYSWGDSAEKIYYSLGANAKPTMNVKVKEYLDKVQKN